MLDEAANVLGALALAVTDQTIDAVAVATGQPVTAAAALSSLHQFLNTPTLDVLHRVLGLTPSGAVRLVDRLQTDGLVARGPGRDGRSRSVALSPAGEVTAVQIAEVRVAALRQSLRDLSEDELTTLKALMDKVLATAVATKFAAGAAGRRWTCRLCHLDACGRAEGHCPSANAAATLVKGGAPY